MNTFGQTMLIQLSSMYFLFCHNFCSLSPFPWYSCTESCFQWDTLHTRRPRAVRQGIYCLCAWRIICKPHCGVQVGVKQVTLENMAPQRVEVEDSCKIFVVLHSSMKLEPFYPCLITLWTPFLPGQEQLSFTQMLLTIWEFVRHCMLELDTVTSTSCA